MIAELEACAFAAWPAEEIVELDGWKLRFCHGVTRRANSVWPARADGGLSTEARIDAVEAFYRARRQPPIFQLSPVSAPAGLDEALAARGYTVDAPVVIAVADCAQLARVTPGTRVERALSSEWFGISAHHGRFAAVADIYRGLLERLGQHAHFALAEGPEGPVAVGLGVCAGPWLGVFAMRTEPRFQRRGHARAILGALARAAVDGGCERLYLQVERENAAARALYTSAGFCDVYGYHYRVLRRDPE